VEKEISFVARGVGFDRVKSEADQTMSGLIANARKYSDSGKEQVKYIEDQIRLIKQRNELNKQQALFDLQTDYESKLMSTKSKGQKDDLKSRFEAGKEDIMSGGKEEQLQALLLTDILSTLRETATKQIVEDKKNVENQVKEYDKIMSKGGDVDDVEAFIRTQQKEKIGTSKSEEADESMKFASKGGSAFNTVTGIATSRNEIYGLAASLAVIPIVGQGLAQLASKFIEDGTRLEKATKKFQSTTGSSIDFKEASDYGYTQSEVYEFGRNLSRSRGSAGLDDRSRSIFGGSVQDESRELLMTSKAFDIDQSTMLDLSRTQRFDRNERGTFGDIQNLMAVMKKEGVFGSKGDDYSSLTSILETQNQLIQDQSNMLETVNTDSNLRVIAAFNKIGGSFAADDIRSKQRIQTVNQSLTNPQGDFRQAFSFNALRQIKPDASLFELMEMQERGIAQPEYMAKVMENLKMRGGSKDSQMLQMSSLFNLSKSQSRAMFESGEDFSSIASGNLGELGFSSEEVKAKAVKATGVMDKRTAQMSDVFAEGGMKGLQMLDEGFSKSTKKVDEWTGAMTNFVDKMKQTYPIFEKITKLFPNGAATANSDKKPNN